MSEKNYDLKKWTFRLAGVEWFYWMAFACHNYLTVYLDAHGYTAEQVSVLNTVLSAVGVIATPIGGNIADRIHSSRKAMIIVLAGCAITYALIPLTINIMIASTLSVALLFIVVSRAFQGPSSSLMETTVINGCNKTGAYYGFVRIWGTISYVIMCLICGRFVTGANAQLTFYALGALIIPCILFGMSIKEISDSAKPKKTASLKDLPFGKLFKNPYFLVYIIFSILDKVPSTCIMVFQPYLIKEVGGNMGLVGYIQAYRATFEIPTLLLSSKLEKKMSYRMMIIINAVLYGLQCILYAGVQNFPAMIAVTTLSGIASGFTIAGAARYVFQLSPKELQSTAQTLTGATMSLSGILGGIMGRALIALMGIRDLYVVIGIMMLLSVVVFVGLNWYLEKVRKIEFIDYTKEPEKAE